jgi:hypothetical protein
MTDALLTDTAGGVLTLTLNAPALRNSMAAPGLREALRSAVEDFARDPALHVLVLTGGGGVFSAGGDLRALKQLDAAALRDRLAEGAWLYRRLVMGEKPVISAVEGPAYGAGMGLAIVADTVVAAEGARFCSAFIRVGAMPDAALFWSLPSRVGQAKARDMMLYGEEIAAEEAGTEGRRASGRPGTGPAPGGRPGAGHPPDQDHDPPCADELRAGAAGRTGQRTRPVRHRGFPRGRRRLPGEACPGFPRSVATPLSRAAAPSSCRRAMWPVGQSGAGRPPG